MPPALPPCVNPSYFVETVDRSGSFAVKFARDASKTCHANEIPVPVRLRGTLMFRPPTREQIRAMLNGSPRRPRPKHTPVPSFVDACRVRLFRGQPLYDRLGGEAGLEALTQKLASLCAKSKELKVVADLSPLSEAPFLRTLMGGPGCYDGPTLKEAHAKVTIPEHAITAFLAVFVEAAQFLDVSPLVLTDVEHLLAAVKDDMLPPVQPAPTRTVEDLAALSEKLEEPAPAEAAVREIEAEETAEETAEPVYRTPAPSMLNASAASAQLFQGSLQEALEQEAGALATAVEGSQSGDVDEMQRTIKDLEQRLQHALNERARYEEEAEYLRGTALRSSAQSVADWEDGQGSLDGDPGFLVDFEIDPTTMEVRVEVVSSKQANSVPLVDVAITGD